MLPFPPPYMGQIWDPPDVCVGISIAQRCTCCCVDVSVQTHTCKYRVSYNEQTCMHGVVEVDVCVFGHVFVCVHI